MPLAIQRRMTLEDYLNREDDGTDTRYELVNGELVEMPTESNLNTFISLYLFAELLKLVSIRLLRHKDTEILVTGSRVTVRLPDLMVLSEETAAALAGATRSLILPDMSPPVLVLEVVSPGVVNEERDYRYKRSEYAARGIGEYWLIDPQQGQVTVLTLVAGLYEDAVFRDDEVLVSQAFPGWTLSAAQILQTNSKSLGKDHDVNHIQTLAGG